MPMGHDDKARQLRAEARRRRRDEALRRFQERTERRSTERDTLEESRRAAAARLELAQAEARARLDTERRAAEEAERRALEEAERLAAEKAERQEVDREETERLELEEAGPSGAGPEGEASLTADLPAAPRERPGTGGANAEVPTPPSPRRSLGVRLVRLLGSLAVAVGSVASIMLAAGSLMLALGERPAGVFDALEPICDVLALSVGADLSALDTLVTWIIAAVAYLIVGFALQAFSRHLTRPRQRR